MARPAYSMTRRYPQKFKDLLSGRTSELSVPSESAAESSDGTSRRKPVGWISPTAYSMVGRWSRASTGVHSVSKVYPTYTQGYEYTGQVVSLDNSGPIAHHAVCNAALTEPSTGLNDEVNNAKIKAFSNLKGKSIDLGVAFGERNQTARLLGDTATRLARSVRALKHGEVRKAMRELGISSQKGEPRGSNWPQKWLELQYGWKPFLSDVYGAASALENRDRSDWRVTAKGTAKKNLRGLKHRNPVYPDPVGYFCSAEGWQGAFVRLDAVPNGSFSGTLSSLGVINPLLVAWELVPYSFVVDWCLPIGGWLESLDAMLQYESAVQSVSTFTKVDWSYFGLSAKWADGTEVVNNFSGTRSFVALNRSVGAATLPSFPSFKDPRSLGHMANGLALLSAAFAR